MVAATVVGGTAPLGFALSSMAAAIKALYQMGESIDDFIDEHIEALKRSADPLTASTGRVLQAAKTGFFLGYSIPVIVMATGQLLLGNPLSAALVVGNALVLSNPIAMTCAAVGAIYYGWNALTEVERNAILDRLSEGFQVGIELIRSALSFVLRKMRDFFTSKQLLEFKEYIKAQAANFGRSLYDVTGMVGDLVRGAGEKVSEMAGNMADATLDLAKGAYQGAAEIASDAASATKEAAERVGTATTDGMEVVVSQTRKVLRRGTKRSPGKDATTAAKD